MGPLSDLPPDQQRDSFLDALRPHLSGEALEAVEAWAQERVVEGDREALGLPTRLSALEEAMEKALPRVEALENKQPNNAYRRKVKDGHHHEMPVEGMDDQVSVGFGFQLDATEGIDQTRGSWPNNLRLTLSGAGSVGPFCFDYLVRPSWTGTEGKEFTFQDSSASFFVYSTVAAAWAAASTAASTSGTKTIMVCSSVTEGLTEIGGLGSSATIIITSPDRYAVTITGGANEDLFKQDSSGGATAGRLLFREIGLAPASGKAVLDANHASLVRNLEFEGCRFTESGSYLARQESTINLGLITMYVRRCVGSLAGFYHVAGSSAALGPNAIEAHDNGLTMTKWWDGGSAHGQPDFTRVQGGFYTISDPQEFANGAAEQHWSGLVIRYGGSTALFTSDSNSSQNQDLTFQNIIFRTSANGGDFCDFQSHASNPHKRIYIDNIFGFSEASPSGTFITIDTVITDSFVGNIRAPQWPTLFSGDLTDMDATHYHSLIRDDDGDTQIQAEESADEDIIRFDVGGTETMLMGDTGGAGEFGGSAHQVHWPMQADQDILIDGFTNPRTVDTGVLRFEHKPSIENTRCLTLNIDANSEPGTHGEVINMIATQLAAGEIISAYQINFDAGNSSGGHAHGFEVSLVGGTAGVEAVGLHVNPGVSVIHQESGVFINVESAWENAVDVTTPFNTSDPGPGANNVELFSSNGDVVTIGMDAAFDHIEAILETLASGAGIKPTFEYSIAGPAWATFMPDDETLGFRRSGIIDWEIADLTNWVATTDNGVSKFWIRITRTQVGLTTPPVEDTIQVQAITAYSWDPEGNLIVNSLSTDTISERTPAAGVTIDSLLIKDGKIAKYGPHAYYIPLGMDISGAPITP